MRFLFLLLTITLVAENTITTHTTNNLTYTVTVHSGEVSYIAYTKEGQEQGQSRPITFAFNGGPGSSSVWLHMGAFGPRRVKAPEEGQSLAPPYEIMDNPDTILDLTDIVFIDPSGTGLSDLAEQEKEDPYSVVGDICSVGDFIRDYLTKNKRWNSPKYLAGESYGAVRAAGLAEYLLHAYGVYLNGLILVSAAIDYQTFLFHQDNPLPYFLYLPTFATTAWYHNRYKPDATIEEVAQEARDFVYKTYAPSLICRKCSDLAPIYQRLSELTGLSLDFIRKQHGYITADNFFVEFFASQNQLIGRYDSRDVGYLVGKIFHDPSDRIIGIFSGALHQYLHDELDCPQSYNLLSMKVHNQWNFFDYNSGGYPNLMNALRKSLIANPFMKIFVGCGYYDLATPFATVEYCFDHLEVPNTLVQMEYYEGGHMYYLNPSARTKFKQDLTKFYKNN